MSTSSPSITVTVSVSHTESGGNTADGRYFYAFDRNRILLESSNTLLTFALSERTAADFVIDSLVSSDTLGQLQGTSSRPNPCSISVVVKNSVNYLIQIALIVRHNETGELIICDPQVICRPKPVF